MSNQSPSLDALDNGLSDWLVGPACDDTLYTGDTSCHPDALTDAYSWSLDTVSDEAAFSEAVQADERQAIFEEMQAVGLHRPGRFMRQAFSLGDLTLLQPPSEPYGAMANMWSPSSTNAQALLWSQSYLPEVSDSSILPPHQPHHMLGSGLGVCKTVPDTVHDVTLGCIPEHEMLQGASQTLPGSCHRIGRKLPAGRMRRSQSALELGSTIGPANKQPSLQHADAPKQVGTELTTPEGHVYRAGRLAPQERLQKILKYRQKRHERNFTKRIKYQCRKTLADSRPRVRGRFARNDDSSAVMPPDIRKRAT